MRGKSSIVGLLFLAIAAQAEELLTRTQVMMGYLIKRMPGACGVE